MSETSASAKAPDDNIVVEKKGRATAKKQRQVIDPSFNMDELRALADLVIENGFTDFEFENENIRVRLSKTTNLAAAQPVQAAAPVAAPAAPAAAAAEAAPAEAP